jgi:hypothetical protein
MLQFGASLIASSNPFCVNGKQLLSRNRERPGDRRGLMRRSKMNRGTFSHSGTFLLMIYAHDLFERDKMIKRIGAAVFAGSLLVGPAVAQSTTPSSEKQETSCTTSSAATSGSGSERTSNSMAVEKSAVLPDAGGSNSAAPTVQSGSKPMEVRPDCPPDSKPK